MTSSSTTPWTRLPDSLLAHSLSWLEDDAKGISFALTCCKAWDTSKGVDVVFKAVYDRMFDGFAGAHDTFIAGANGNSPWRKRCARRKLLERNWTTLSGEQALVGSFEVPTHPLHMAISTRHLFMHLGAVIVQYELETGAIVQSWLAPVDPLSLNSTQFDPDRDQRVYLAARDDCEPPHLVLATGSSVLVLDLNKQGELLAELQVPDVVGDPIRCVAVSPNNRRLLVVYSHHARMFDARTGARLWSTHTVEESTLLSACFATNELALLHAFPVRDNQRRAEQRFIFVPSERVPAMTPQEQARPANDVRFSFAAPVSYVYPAMPQQRQAQNLNQYFFEMPELKAEVIVGGRGFAPFAPRRFALGTDAAGGIGRLLHVHGRFLFSDVDWTLVRTDCRSGERRVLAKLDGAVSHRGVVANSRFLVVQVSNVLRSWIFVFDFSGQQYEPATDSKQLWRLKQQTVAATAAASDSSKASSAAQSESTLAALEAALRAAGEASALSATSPVESKAAKETAATGATALANAFASSGALSAIDFSALSSLLAATTLSSDGDSKLAVPTAAAASASVSTASDRDSNSAGRAATSSSKSSTAATSSASNSPPSS